MHRAATLRHPHWSGTAVHRSFGAALSARCYPGSVRTPAPSVFRATLPGVTRWCTPHTVSLSAPPVWRGASTVTLSLPPCRAGLSELDCATGCELASICTSSRQPKAG